MSELIFTEWKKYTPPKGMPLPNQPMTTKGVYLKLVDYDDMIARVNSPVIINNLGFTTKNDKKALVKMMHTEYDGDSMSVIPSCECGKYSSEKMRGHLCEDCGEPVVSSSEKPIESKLWLAVPRKVHAFINPCAWVMLSKAFTVSGFNILEYLCYTKYQSDNSRHEGIILRIKELGIGRGYNNFIENYLTIFENLIDEKLYSGNREDIVNFISEFHNDFFSTYLPIPNKLAFVIEKTALGTYVDMSIGSAIDAALIIASIDESDDGTAQYHRENRTAKCVMRMAEYYMSFMKETIGVKGGWFRGQIFGSSINYSARAVITSRTDSHDHRCIKLSWSIAVALFRTHLKSLMLKAGYSPKEINVRIVTAISKYDDEIHKYLLAIIKGKNGKKRLGFPCTFGRNPSLHRGSIQFLYIDSIGTDPKIHTIQLSVLILKAYNADFDGKFRCRR